MIKAQTANNQPDFLHYYVLIPCLCWIWSSWNVVIFLCQISFLQDQLLQLAYWPIVQTHEADREGRLCHKGKEWAACGSSNQGSNWFQTCCGSSSSVPALVSQGTVMERKYCIQYYLIFQPSRVFLKSAFCAEALLRMFFMSLEKFSSFLPCHSNKNWNK